METLANYTNLTHDTWFLTEKVRQALGLQICQQYMDPETKILHVVTVSSYYCEQIKKFQMQLNDGEKPFVAFPIEIYRQWVNDVNDCFSKVSNLGFQPIIYVENSIRRGVRSLCEIDFPGAVVISDLELIAAGRSIKAEILGEISHQDS